MIDQQKMKTMNKQITWILALLLAAPFISLGQDKYGETAEQQLLCKESLSVYSSYKKQGNLDEAYIQWLKACNVCPPTAREGLYSDGVRFLKNELKKASTAGNEERATTLHDSIFLLYDQRMELFPSTTRKPNNRCVILGYKAADYYRLNKDDPAAANAMFKESVDCLQEASSAAILSQYYVTSFYTMKGLEDDAAKEKLGEMLTEYLVLTDYIEIGLAAAITEENIKGQDGYEKAKGNIDEVFIAIAQCEDMVPVLAAKIDGDSTNIDLKKKVLRLLNKKECSDNDLFLPVAIAVHEIEPSHPSAYAIGYSQAKNDNFNEAFSYMEQAVELCGDCAEKEAYLLKAGQIASYLKKTTAARNFAQQVLDMNSRSAEAYMLIGDAIAGAASFCDDKALGMRLAYLRAADYYGQAKAMAEGDVAVSASKKLNSSKKQFPSVEEVFTVGKSAGASIQIPAIPGCPCSGETTTIRVR